MQINDKTKKALNVVLNVVTILIVAFSVFMMIFTVFTVTTVDKNDRDIFGIRFYIVQTDSMSKSDKNADLDVHFDAGDIILVKDIKDKRALEPGDIISFISVNPDSYGETITHMIKSVIKNEDDVTVGYNTYGTHTGTEDAKPVELGYIIGEYAGKLPGVGKFFAFVKSTPGYIVCILLPFLLLILYNGVNCIRLFRQYKREQNAEIEAERAQIAVEREQNAQMFRELMALKAQLAAQGGDAEVDKNDPETDTSNVIEENPSEKQSDSEEKTEKNSDLEEKSEENDLENS